MGAPLSGKDGTFKKAGSPLVVDVLRWDFEPAANEQRFASDKTSGTKQAYVTVKDWNARVQIKVHATEKLPFNIDDEFAMELHGDDSGNNFISGTCVVVGHSVPCDITEGQESEVEYTLGPRSPVIYHGIYFAGVGSSGE